MRTNRHVQAYALASFLVIGALCASAGNETEGNSVDIVAGYHWLTPRKDMDWKDAGGIEVGARFWMNKHIGLALAAASDTWKARPETVEEDTGDTYLYTSVTGDASLMSLGASLCYRSDPAASVKLIMEMGLRYAMVDSSVYGEAAYDGPGGPNYIYEKIDIDDTMLFVVGAGVDFEMTKNVSLILGVGYQVDLKKPEEMFAGESLGETGFDGISLGVALCCKL
jgi:opacity protein-like surface antigen